MTTQHTPSRAVLHDVVPRHLRLGAAKRYSAYVNVLYMYYSGVSGALYGSSVQYIFIARPPRQKSARRQPERHRLPEVPLRRPPLHEPTLGATRTWAAATCCAP